MGKKTEKLKIDRNLVKRIGGLYRPFMWPAIIAFLILLFNQMVWLIPAYLVGTIINGLQEKWPTNQLIGLVVLSTTISIVNTLIVRWRINYEYQRIDYKLPMLLSLGTLDNLFKFSAGQNRANNSGKIKGIVDQGERALSDLLPLLLYNVVPIVVQTVVAASALFWFDWVVGGVVLSAIFIYFGLITWLYRKYSPKLDALQDARDYRNSLHHELVRNLSAIQLAGQENRSRKRLEHRLSLFSSYGERMWQGLIGARNLIGLVSDVGNATAMILVVYFCLQGKYGPGAVVTTIMWMNRSLSGIGQLGYYQKQLAESFSAIRKYFTVMDVAPAVKEIEKPVSITGLRGEIEFKNVFFRYPDRKALLKKLGEEELNNSDQEEQPEALRKVSLQIEAGEKVAIVGHSGAGKSTLVALLTRAYDPQEGAITVDGHDLRTLDLRNFRGQVGVVEQSVTLFDSSLRDNILFGVPSWMREMITNEDIERVLELARINTFRDRLTAGLQTKIGENGIFLSGGEKQRVGIARALIKNPSILILDEATSNLDAVNERHIREAVDEASKGRTTIIIAHRLSTVKNADRIFVFKKGRVVSVGTHDELLNSCEIYQELVESQLA